MSEQDRPVHHEFNCATGATTVTELTDGELEGMRRRDQAEAQRKADEEAREQVLRDAVAAHPDPVVQALAKRAGLV